MDPVSTPSAPVPHQEKYFFILHGLLMLGLLAVLGLSSWFAYQYFSGRLVFISNQETAIHETISEVLAEPDTGSLVFKMIDGTSLKIPKDSQHDWQAEHDFVYLYPDEQRRIYEKMGLSVINVPVERPGMIYRVGAIHALPLTNREDYEAAHAFYESLRVPNSVDFLPHFSEFEKVFQGDKIDGSTAGYIQVKQLQDGYFLQILTMFDGDTYASTECAPGEEKIDPCITLAGKSFTISLSEPVKLDVVGVDSSAVSQ